MYDPECQKLAEYFLQDEPMLKADLSFVGSLAQEIQTMIELSIDLRKSEIRAETRRDDVPQQPGD